MSVARIDIFAALEVVVLEKDRDAYRIVNSSSPPWWMRFVTSPSQSVARADLETAFPFLESFLFEAEQIWRGSTEHTWSSEVWQQKDLAGEETALEVTAVGTPHSDVLLLRVATPEYRERTRVLEEARERGLARELLDGRVRSLTNLNEELETRAVESERINRLKSEFVASISHELRTPLNAMIGFSTLLLQGRAGTLNLKQAEFVSHVQRGANHLLALINDVLELSKTDAGRLLLEKSSFVATGVVDEVLSSLRPQAEMKGILLTSRCPEKLTVYADRLRMKQILYNLLSNSIRFTGRGGTVDVAFERGRDRLLCTVTDTGVGIPEHELAKIFEPFYQGVSSQHSKEGTGLGLAITKRLVEEHGGAIAVESEPGRGTRFHLWLPVEDASQDDTFAGPASSEMPDLG